MRAELRESGGAGHCVAPMLESLEPRVLLAGNVSVMTAGGSLFLTGDNLANDFYIEEIGGGNNFRLTSGPDATTFNGLASLDVPSMNGDMYVWLNGGDDRFGFWQAGPARDVMVFGGPGNNTFDAERFTIGRNLSLFGGTGNDEVRLSDIGAVIGSLFIDNSLGAGDVSIEDTTTHGVTVVSAGNNSVELDGATVNGNLFVSTSIGGAALVVDGSTVHGSVTVSHAGGGVAPGFSDYASCVRMGLGPSVIDGSLNVFNGAGDDLVSLTRVMLHGSLLAVQGPDAACLYLEQTTVDGTVTSLRGEGGDLAAYAGYASLFWGQQSTLHGVTLLNGWGADQTVLQDSGITGSLFVQNGMGAARTSISGSNITGATSLFRGEGGSVPGDTSYASTALIGPGGTLSGAVLCINGSGNDRFVANTTTLGGAVSLYNGLGAASASFTAVTVNGALTFLRGPGGMLPAGGYSGELSLIGGGVGGNISYFSSTGDDFFSAINASLGGGIFADFGPDAANASFTGTTVDEGVMMFRSGGELTDYPGVAGRLSAADSTIGGALQYFGGSDNEDFRFDTLHANSSVSLYAGTGSMRFQAEQSSIAGALSVNMWGGAGTFLLGSVDAVTSIGGNLSFMSGEQGETVILRRLDVTGVTTLATAGGEDWFWVDDSVFTGGFTMNTGEGVDLVDIERRDSTASNSRFIGPAQIDTGGGQDRIRIGVSGDLNARAHFDGALRIDGGLGADSLDYLTGGNTLDVPPVIVNVETIA